MDICGNFFQHQRAANSPFVYDSPLSSSFKKDTYKVSAVADIEANIPDAENEKPLYMTRYHPREKLENEFNLKEHQGSLGFLMGVPTHASIPAWQRDEVAGFTFCCPKFAHNVYNFFQTFHEKLISNYKKTGVVFMGEGFDNNTKDFVHVSALYGDSDRDYYNPTEAQLATGVCVLFSLEFL